MGVIEAFNGTENRITGISPAEKCAPGDLVFADREEFIDAVIHNGCTAVVTGKEYYDRLIESPAISVFLARNIGVAHALIRQRYADRDVRKTEWERIHHDAVIHDSATVHETAIIGPKVVIGRGVRIERECVVMANTVVEHNAILGEASVVHPSVVIGYDTVVGKRVIIKSGTVIGAEGFGFARDHENRSHRIPQVGRVVIHNDVVIGANCCIDRAAYDETVIGRGTKLDNLCHIAHNVRIGEDCLLTAGFTVAGSTEIGDRVIASGQTGILDHLKIGNDVVLVHRAGVIENIPNPGVYAGLPTQPLQGYLRNVAVMKKLSEMRKTVVELEKRLEALSREDNPQ
jgi:UDP-3-O-[3-hydroxymyristoyl] glucosamine N-acyltransferase